MVSYVAMRCVASACLAGALCRTKFCLRPYVLGTDDYNCSVAKSPKLISIDGKLSIAGQLSQQLMYLLVV